MSARFALQIGFSAVIMFGILPLIAVKVNRYLGFPVISSSCFFIIGSILLLFGITIIMLSARALFFKPKQQMLSPTHPPPKFIVDGLYRHVRNPMYLGYFTVILSEFFLFGHLLLLGYLAVIILFVHLMVVYNEERGLEKAFGPEYTDYKARVPRWIPRWHTQSTPRA